MTRSLTTGTLTAIQGQRSEQIHLLELAFSGGTVRFATHPFDVSWNSVTWSAAGGALSFEGVNETPDISGQRVRVNLDGVSLTAITALLAQNYIGRLAKLYRAHLNPASVIIVDPVLLFLGYMNSPWEITEDWDNAWCKVTTELVSPLAVLEQTRGITADPNSHQAVYSGDTFFTHTVTKPAGQFGWGIADTVPVQFDTKKK